MRSILIAMAALALAGCVDSTYRCGTAAGEYACTDGLACDAVSGACLPCVQPDRNIACPTGMTCRDVSDEVNACHHSGLYRCTSKPAVPPPDGGC